METQISKILKKSMGLEVEPSENMKRIVKKSSEYFAKINQPQEAIKREKPTNKVLKEALKQKANEITGDFVINNENKEVINSLFWYFSNNPKFNNSNIISNEPSLKKGILLIGNTGSGKTTILDIFKALKWQGFRKFSTYDVVEDFEKSGEKGIVTYFNGNIFFDDLGTENEAMYYGKRENVGTRLIEKRYNSYIRDGLKTHVTTNLSINDLVDKYGFRIEGRIYEMFNIIKLGSKSDSIDFRTSKHKKNEK